MLVTCPLVVAGILCMPHLRGLPGRQFPGDPIKPLERILGFSPPERHQSLLSENPFHHHQHTTAVPGKAKPQGCGLGTSICFKSGTTSSLCKCHSLPISLGVKGGTACSVFTGPLGSPPFHLCLHQVEGSQGRRGHL